MKTTKETRARGRVMNAPVGGQVWSFRMTSAGVQAKVRNARRHTAITIDLATLTRGGAMEIRWGDEVWAAKVENNLLMVIGPGTGRRWVEVPWGHILNLVARQPVLFPEAEACGSPKEAGQ